MWDGGDSLDAKATMDRQKLDHRSYGWNSDGSVSRESSRLST